MGRVAILILCAVSTAGLAAAQACPKSSETGPSVSSGVRTLEGRLLFHDDIRQWFELKLDSPQCGEASVQLIQEEPTGTPLEVLRGCRVKSRGALDFPSTGYYSARIYQDVQAIEPVGECSRQPLFPDYSKARPDKAIRAYRVDVHVQYEPGDHPIVFRVTSAGKELKPWQAYASYVLTGAFVLYGHCGDGFVVDRVFGTPEAHPDHVDYRAAFDPEGAAAVGTKNLELGYTCVRSGGSRE
jgi:hypothetical protein